MGVVAFIINFIPYKKIYPFSLFVGKIFYYIFYSRTQIAYYNLNKILPDIPFYRKKELIIKSYASLVANILELIKIQNFSDEELKKIFYIHNVENLESLLSKDKGCILITGHFGNWELSVVLPKFINKSILTIGKKQRPEFFNNFLFKIRTKFGMKVIEHKKAILTIFKTLKRKEIVGLIVDQRSKKKDAATINFFGEKIYATNSPAFLALKTDAPVICCYSEREKDGTHHFYFTEEIILKKEGDFNKLLEENTQIIHDKLTEIILKNPDNWFWLHSKFKNKRKVLKEIKK